jgi:ferredoxin
MPLHEVVAEKCKGEGVCVAVCGKSVLEIEGGRARTRAGREERCIRCGACVATCPTAALSMPELGSAGWDRVRKDAVAPDDLHDLLSARRSVRCFAPEPVERALLERILAAAALAPMAFVPTTEVVVLDTRAELDRLTAALRAGYDQLLGYLGSPIKRAVIRWKRGPETYRALQGHVAGIVADNNARFAATGQDFYLYGAPALMIFHADRWSVGYQENAAITATYAMLAAHALGLGATLLSIVPPLLNNLDRALAARYGIPEENRAVIAMIVGHPRYPTQRQVPRRLKGVRWV